MDKATIIGFVAGTFFILISIMMGGSIGSFINPPSLMIVIGGTTAATFIHEKMESIFNGINVVKNCFVQKAPNVEETIKTIASLAIVVRKEGLLALENQQIDNYFLAKGVRLAVDGIPPEEIQTTLRSELVSLKSRHKRGKQLFEFMAETSPAFGMIGTLIGLVQMLQEMDDPSKIGPAMAVALLTTFYGAVMAFFIFGPLAKKLGHRSTEETANMVVIVEGLDSILKGENARIVQEKLEGFLPPAQRTPESQM